MARFSSLPEPSNPIWKLLAPFGGFFDARGWFCSARMSQFPGIPTTIKTMGVNITTSAYLRVLIIEFGSAIIFFMVVEAQGIVHE